MNVSTIKSFIKFIKESRYNEFCMRDGDVSLSIKFKNDAESQKIQGIYNVSSAAKGRTEDSAAPASAANEKENEFIKIITAPIVGRFYSTMTSEKFEPIKRGDFIKKKQTLCMIEAMNIEHEISSPYDGVMEETIADDGCPVMYGQPLFKIRLSQ